MVLPDSEMIVNEQWAIVNGEYFVLTETIHNLTLLKHYQSNNAGIEANFCIDNG